jgi:hypothetical protein
VGASLQQRGKQKQAEELHLDQKAERNTSISGQFRHGKTVSGIALQEPIVRLILRLFAYFIGLFWCGTLNCSSTTYIES